MKIGVFGDIHGNLEALHAAYNAIEKSVDKIFHLGDLGGYAPFVNEVVDFLIGHEIDGVQGNYDDAVANDREHCGCKHEDPLQAEMAELSFAWTKQHVTPKTKRFLKGLPFKITLTSGDKKIVFFHATPIKNNLYWYEDRPDKFFSDMARRADADIFIYGHTHRPYRRDIDGKVFVNAGSVGKPKDDDPRACVAIIEITSDAVKTNFLRVEYNREKVASAIIGSGLPAYFAEKLIQAG